MRTFKRDRGFLVFAQNGSTDFVRLAYGLALSLRATQSEVPWLSVMVTPGTEMPDRYREVFDEVIDIPWGDEAQNSDWKLENEWKAIHCTPYRETIKLDADMLFTHDIASWWDVLARQEMWFATDVMTYRGDVATSDHYRKTFTANDLPNVYTAMMYFKVTDFSLELFKLVEDIYHNWQAFFDECLDDTRPDHVSTDVVFALAIKLLGIETDVTFPGFPVPTFVHMKSRMQGWPDASEDWMSHISGTVTPELEIKIGRYLQTFPVHYQDKRFLTDDILALYEAKA